MDTELTRRRLLTGLAPVGVAAFGGCVTADLSLRTEGVDESDIFESVSLLESWTATKALVAVTFTEKAATEASVRELAVVNSTGENVWSDTLKPGQTSVTDVRVPVGEPATLAAANGSGSFVDSVTVAVRGSSVP